MVEILIRIIEEKPTCTSTLQDMNERLRLEIPLKPQVTIQALSKNLSEALITIKDLSTRSSGQWNTPTVKRERRLFVEWLRMEGQMSLKFIWMNLELTYGPPELKVAHKKEIAQYESSEVKEVRIFVFGCQPAIWLFALLHWKTFEGGLKNGSQISWLKSQISNTLFFQSLQSKAKSAKGIFYEMKLYTTDDFVSWEGRSSYLCMNL